MAYHSKYSGAEVDALLDKIKDDNVGSIDSSLSTTSENPVKNKVITEELNKKANKTDIATINGQPLTNGGNIEVVTEAYDDTEIKGKLTELDSQIANEATARTEADAALQTQINGKQEALTLTVKDNGNIVLANIQGQSKEFMSATPSGDPMHYAYVAAGAEYNNTGADIVRTTPWADMIDDDYTGDYGKTVVHKAGYWYLNGLGDLTNNDMLNIMQTNRVLSLALYAGDSHKFRTNLSFEDNNAFIYNNMSRVSELVRNNSRIEVLRLPTSNNYSYAPAEIDGLCLGATKLIHIINILKGRFLSNISDRTFYCGTLRTIKFQGLKCDVSFRVASGLTLKSVLYMINNEAATSPITITLHADVYNKCMANADILAALQAHTNVSLASA